MGPPAGARQSSGGDWHNLGRGEGSRRQPDLPAVSGMTSCSKGEDELLELKDESAWGLVSERELEGR